MPVTNGPLTGLRWEEALERVLQEAARPLHVRDIWAGLAEGGFRTGAHGGAFMGRAVCGST